MIIDVLVKDDFTGHVAILSPVGIHPQSTFICCTTREYSCLDDPGKMTVTSAWQGMMAADLELGFRGFTAVGIMATGITGTSGER